MSLKKCNLKILISLVGIVISLLCLGGCGAEQEVRGSVVLVETGLLHSDDMWEPLVRGTGFFVGKHGTAPDTVITSGRTVGITGEKITVPYTEAKTEIRVYVSGEKYINSALAASDADHDIAVLRLSEPSVSNVPLKTAIPYDEMTGSNVRIAGYTGATGSSEDVTKAELLVKTATVERIYTEAGSSVQWLLLNGDTAGYLPGSPVINENGSVIAVFCGNYPPGTDTAEDSPENKKAEYAESIEVTKMLLDSKLIANEAEAAFPWLTVVLIAVSVIIAIFAILVIARVIARKKNPPKLQANGQGPIPTVSSEQSGDSGFRIECVEGALAGKKIMIKTSGTLVIGSKPGMCSVVIPGNPAGVGSRHCEIWYNGSEVCIRDAGSPHGTVLSSAGKLSPNETAVLKEGDGFSIGTDEQKFVIRKKKEK